MKEVATWDTENDFLIGGFFPGVSLVCKSRMSGEI